MATETKPNIVKVKSSNQDGSSKGTLDASMKKKKIESFSKQPADAKQKSVSTVTIKTEVKSKTGSSSSKSSTTTKTKIREKKVYTLPGQKHDPPEEREPLRIFYESLSKQIPTSEMAEFWDQRGSGSKLSSKTKCGLMKVPSIATFLILGMPVARLFTVPLLLSRKRYMIQLNERERLMEHGLLSPEKARKAYEKKQRRQKQLRTGTPLKPSKPSSKPESSQKQQLTSKNGDIKAKKRIDNNIDDDDDFILSPKRRKE